MKNQRKIAEYPFLNPSENDGYRLFPSSIEDEDLIVFHGTSKEDLNSILINNFQVSGELESISFASSSGIALGYGCKKRSSQSPEGAVIAVKLQSLSRPHVISFGGIIYLYKPDLVPPTIIGYCIIPRDYVFK